MLILLAANVFPFCADYCGKLHNTLFMRFLVSSTIMPSLILLAAKDSYEDRCSAVLSSMGQPHSKAPYGI